MYSFVDKLALLKPEHQVSVLAQLDPLHAARAVILLSDGPNDVSALKIALEQLGPYFNEKQYDEIVEAFRNDI